MNTSICYEMSRQSLPRWGDLEGFYAPFGEVLHEYNAYWMLDTIPRLLFNGKELDEESGMYYYSARYFKPPTFISRDLLFEQKHWLNPYHYCSNNPINRIDPTGAEDNPIFDWQGNLLGTDDKGIQGEPIIMNEENFTDNMPHNEAVKKGTFRSELPMLVHPDILDKIDNQTASSPTQPNSNRLSQNAGIDGGEHFIGPALILSGQRINRLKPVGVFGTKPGSSIASVACRNIPGKLPFRFLGTTGLGAALGRLVPYAGWALTGLDIISLMSPPPTMTPDTNGNLYIQTDNTNVFIQPSLSLPNLIKK